MAPPIGATTALTCGDACCRGSAHAALDVSNHFQGPVDVTQVDESARRAPVVMVELPTRCHGRVNSRGHITDNDYFVSQVWQRNFGIEDKRVAVIDARTGFDHQ